MQKIVSYLNLWIDHVYEKIEPDQLGFSDLDLHSFKKFFIKEDFTLTLCTH